MAPSEAGQAGATIAVRLSAASPAAAGTRLLTLSAPEGAVLPAAAAGAHIDLHLPDGAIRQYSVLTPLSTPDSYTIAVKREAQGRGGSRFLHDEAHRGLELRIGHPRNHFALEEAAGETLLIAGGIGITPIYAMFHRLSGLGRRVQLHYWFRSREEALFLGDLQGLPDVTLHPAAPGRTPLAAVLAQAGPETQLYCCGPDRMLAAFEAATRGHAPSLVHVERFAARPAALPDQAFTVALARSGREVRVEAGETILGALRGAGIDLDYSCEEGVCGACEQRVLAGQPLHRDAVRPAAEHDRRSTVLICCAGSLSERLVLDA